jgi:hypothetical protein
VRDVDAENAIKEAAASAAAAAAAAAVAAVAATAAVTSFSEDAEEEDSEKAAAAAAAAADIAAAEILQLELQVAADAEIEEQLAAAAAATAAGCISSFQKWMRPGLTLEYLVSIGLIHDDAVALMLLVEADVKSTCRREHFHLFQRLIAVNSSTACSSNLILLQALAGRFEGYS